MTGRAKQCDVCCHRVQSLVARSGNQTTASAARLARYPMDNTGVLVRAVHVLFVLFWFDRS